MHVEQNIKRWALYKGADLAGITSTDRLAGAPEGFRPEDSLPGAKSVISLARQYPKGLIDVKSAAAYFHFMKQEYIRLEAIAVNLALYIEAQTGGKAVPIPADIPYENWNPDEMFGRPDLSHKHVAEAAGLGAIGRNTLLITPQYGNRVHLISIITDIALEPDIAIKDIVPQCPSSCDACIKACPVSAIKDGRVDQKTCRSHAIYYHSRGWHYYTCWECRKACVNNF